MDYDKNKYDQSDYDNHGQFSNAQIEAEYRARRAALIKGAELDELSMYETVFDRFDDWLGKAKWFFVGVGALAAAIALALWVSPL